MIPKIIHYCWIGDNPLPKSARKCIASWKKNCPDYQIIEWNETNYDFQKNAFMREAYAAKKWGFVPDYARLDIIYRYGGIYLDTDVEVVKPLDPLLNYKGFAGFESEEYIALGLGFGAEQSNDLIKKLLDSYENRNFIIDDKNELIASPVCDTKVMESIGLKRTGERQAINGFVFLPTEYLCAKSPYDGVIRLTENTYSIHHYDASWVSEEGRKIRNRSWRVRSAKYYIKPYVSCFIKVLKKVIGEKNYINLKNSIKKVLGI